MNNISTTPPPTPNNLPADSSADFATPAPAAASAPTPRKRRRWPFIAGGVVTALAGGTAFLWLYDEPVPNDADLLAPNTIAAADFVPVFSPPKNSDSDFCSIPQEERPLPPEPTSNDTRKHLQYFDDLASNPASISFHEIKKSSVSSAKEFYALRNEIAANGVNEKNIAVAREILGARGKTQEAAQKILRNLDLRTPPIQNLDLTTLFPEIMGLHKLVRVASLQVQVLQFDGKTDEAFQLEKSILEFFYRIPVTNREESLVTGLSQAGALNFNISNTFPVLFPRLNKEQCNSLANALLKIENSWNADAFKMTLRTEYTATRNSFKNVALIKFAYEGEGFSTFLFKPNWVLGKIGDKYRTAIQTLNEDSVPSLETSKKASFLDYIIPTKIPTVLVPNLDMAYSAILDYRAHFRAVRIALAARAYSLDNAGNLPPELGVLVPKYLPVLPTDPFSKEKAPLHYDAKQGLIWSIGRNFKDEAGEGYFSPKSDKRNPNADDIAFKIPEAAAR